MNICKITKFNFFFGKTKLKLFKKILWIEIIKKNKK